MTILASGALTSEQLLVFWASLATLLGVAHLLGALARRLGQPTVVGELAAGIVLGPSVMGGVVPGLQAWLFPDDAAQRALLMAVSWIGVVLLLVCTGFETDLKLLRRLGRASAAVATGSLVVPLAGGALLGWLLPRTFVGDGGARSSFVLFLAIALSISALPVIAKVLFDLGIVRRELGQITIAAGMTNDLVGWILLGVVAGMASSDAFSLATLLRGVGGLAAFVVAAFTIGQRGVDRLLRRTREAGRPAALTAAMVIVVLAAGVITQWLGVEAVLGAFIAGVVLGRSRYADRHAQDVLETVTHSVFAPIFFATAGLSVDLGRLATPTVLGWTVAVIAAATLTKFAGAYIGGRVGGLTGRHATALGAALNARGALEIVVATIGLNLGVLNETSYAVIVVMALVTSMAAGPALTAVLRGERIAADESARLAREVLLAASVVGATSALLPTRGGTNSIPAARVLDALLEPDARLTLLTVHASSNDVARRQGAAAVGALSSVVRDHAVDWIDRVDDEAAGAILSEARLGYGLMALGMTRGGGTSAMSPTLHRVIARSPVPVLLVSRSRAVDTVEQAIRHVVVPSTGTRTGRAAQDVAFATAARLGAQAHAVHVVATPSTREPDLAGVGVPMSGDELLAASAHIAAGFGQTAALHRAHGSLPAEELLRHADRVDADLIVAGAESHISGDRVFLGYNAEYLLAHSTRTLVLVLLPR
jgi:Kef-type K+ transport system membrane component KefB/nucleotide-binding universal stress UspA family protein